VDREIKPTRGMALQEYRQRRTSANAHVHATSARWYAVAELASAALTVYRVGSSQLGRGSAQTQARPQTTIERALAQLADLVEPGLNEQEIIHRTEELLVWPIIDGKAINPNIIG
jgi:hypothetical protein